MSGGVCQGGEVGQEQEGEAEGCQVDEEAAHQDWRPAGPTDSGLETDEQQPASEGACRHQDRAQTHQTLPVRPQQSEK